MKKIYLKDHIQEVTGFPNKVVKSIYKTIDILNENYGVNRKIDSELGGYILLVKNIIDIGILKQGILKGVVPEYTDSIECSEGVNWASSLFLLSNDYSIVDVTTEELSKLLLE
ncbi:hypothetical protein ACSXBY_08745 [Clostridium perfringens]|uniref:hypothetical protein n=1 Tax=Clostridium perfringens TaxID=1502 RepID=UPI0021473081|nr:hypothetical protein [Clostridium perfringens]MCI5750302.1 hypothetical protein [Clostridium perfringens]MDM0928681.1 hypothetical protein [Clostridium perfringens]MDM0952208.1 hypothetical protein [Clostridium perfringens]MDY4421875.1 hypothetical protein [Clostridium perfringens]UUR85473.1 hypothetical protein NQ194_07715 [Clostridium perfringens]